MIRFYADECVHGLVVRGLRERGVDVLTVPEDGFEGEPDPVVLDRATELERILISQDQDLLVEATRRQREGESFAGLIYAHQDVPIRVCIDDLELIATAGEASELRGWVEYLPLR